MYPKKKLSEKLLQPAQSHLLSQVRDMMLETARLILGNSIIVEVLRDDPTDVCACRSGQARGRVLP